MENGGSFFPPEEGGFTVVPRNYRHKAKLIAFSSGSLNVLFSAAELQPIESEIEIEFAEFARGSSIVRGMFEAEATYEYRAV